MRRFATRLGALALALLGGAVPLVSSAPAAGAAEATVIGTVVSGFHHTCVVMSNNTAQCWGYNSQEQVGQSTGGGDVTTPTQVLNLTNVVSVASGDNHTCALKLNGTVECWGLNGFGQLGRGTTDGGATPQPVKLAGGATLGGITEITAGSFFSCALQNTGKVFCWGENQLSQTGSAPILPNPGAGIVGDPFATVQEYEDDPTVVPPAPPAQIVKMRNYPIKLSPVEVTGVSSAISIEAGSFHACAVLTTGTVSCWGDNGSGQLGTGSVLNPASSLTLVGADEFRTGGIVPAVAVPDLGRVLGVTAGFAHTCARTTGGDVFCWGGNNRGQLGTGDTSVQFAPAKVAKPAGFEGVRSIGAGYFGTCAVTAVNEVFCWGSNEHGQLGNNTTTDSAAPVKVLGIDSAVAVSPGSEHACAVLSAGTVSCWGADWRGQLGNGGVAGKDPSSTDVLDTRTPIPNSLVPVAASVSGSVAVVKQATTVVPPPGSPGVSPAPSLTEIPLTALSAPVRLLDTRGGATVDNNPAFKGIGPRTPNGADFELKVVSRPGSGIPSGATAVMLNVTAVGAQGDQGYMTIYPCGSTRPEASSLNYNTGNIVPNAVLAKVGTNGNVCIYTSVATDILVDASGYYSDSSTFVSLNPARVFESRTNAAPTVDGINSRIGQLGGGKWTPITLTNRPTAGLPATVASAVLNVTVINPAAGGFLSLVPCSTAGTFPGASNVNFEGGQTIPNMVIANATVPMCIFTDVTTDVAVDVVGYFATTTGYAPLAAPLRFLDTRTGGTTFDGADRPGTPVVGGGQEYRLTVGGRGGISATASSVMLNVTVVGAQQGGYLTVYPCGAAKPETSNVNYGVGKTIANGVAAAIGSNKQVCVWASGTTDILVDVAGTLS